LEEIAPFSGYSGKAEILSAVLPRPCSPLIPVLQAGADRLLKTRLVGRVGQRSRLAVENDLRQPPDTGGSYREAAQASLDGNRRLAFGIARQDQDVGRGQGILWPRGRADEVDPATGFAPGLPGQAILLGAGSDHGQCDLSEPGDDADRSVDPLFRAQRPEAHRDHTVGWKP
jgi:hypothetical protein